jgi:signal transduction histidine kinase
MSKLKIGKFKRNITEVNFRAVLEYLLENFIEEVRYRDIKITYDLDSTLENHMLRTDEMRLSILLYNLISNSVKCTNSGIIHLQAKVLDHNEYIQQLNID